MKKQYKIGMIALIVVVVVVGGILGYNYLNQYEKDKKEAQTLSKQFSVSESYVQQKKASLKAWNKVALQLASEKYSFHTDQATKLVSQGYLTSDIQKAQQLGYDTGVDKMTILKARGSYPNVTPWAKVIKKLKLDTRSPAEKMGLSKADIKYFQNKGYSYSEILQIGLLKLNYNLKVSDIKGMLNTGETIDEINSKYSKGGSK